MKEKEPTCLNNCPLKIGFALMLLLGSLDSSKAQILFSRSTGELNTGGTLNLMIYDIPTGTTKMLLKGSVKGRGEYAATSSSVNDKIIFNSYRFSGWKLAIADFKNREITGIKKLTDRSNYEYCGRISPDGSKIVYQEFSWRTRASRIMIADSKGKNSRALFTTGISDQNLDWTRDGQSIVFIDVNGDKLQVCSKDIEEGELKILSDGSANDFAVSTSKTKDQIAFLSDENGKIELFVMNADGSDRRNLTPDIKSKDGEADGIWAYRTCWSPDGEKIVFNVMLESDLEMFVINADGSGSIQITDNNATDMTPFWMN